jgi:hypothetical protein
MFKVRKKVSAVLIATFIAASGTLLTTSCEFEDSMLCRKETYVNGDLESATEWIEYSGAELDDILDMEDVTIGNRTTKWKCK